MKGLKGCAGGTSVDPCADVERLIEDDLGRRRRRHRLAEIGAGDGQRPLLVAVDLHVVELDLLHGQLDRVHDVVVIDAAAAGAAADGEVGLVVALDGDFEE